MSKKVKIGIIGFGFMGTTHFDIYRNNPKAEVVAIADVDVKKRQGDISSVVANISGGDNSKPLDLAGIKTYEDAMELINDPNVEMIDICVPVNMHKKFSLAGIAAGKHVLCEKPLARNSADAAEIYAAADKSNKAFMVGMCVRFWPEYAHARNLINSGKIGKLVSASFRRLSPNIDGNSWQNWFMNAALSGGAIYDLHLHDTDYIRYLLGMPKAVTSFGICGVRSDCGIDHVMTRYDFGDDTLVTAEGAWDASRSTPFEMSFQIVCEKATLRFTEGGYKVCWENGNVEAISAAEEGLPTGWHKEIDYMLECIVKGVKPDAYMGGADVTESIRIVEAEMKSVETKTTVKI